MEHTALRSVRILLAAAVLVVMVLREGDVLVLWGTPEDLEKVENLILGGKLRATGEERPASSAGTQ